SVTTIGVSAIGSLKAAAEGLLRSKPAARSLAAMSCGVRSATAALPRRRLAGGHLMCLSAGSAKLRTGIEAGAVVACRRAGVDRRAARLGELEVPARRAHHAPAFAQGKVD